MKLVLLSLAVVSLAVLGLSVGALLGRRPIQGSCGGIGSQCGPCSGNCRKRNAEGAPSQRVED